MLRKIGNPVVECATLLPEMTRCIDVIIPTWNEEPWLGFDLELTRRKLLARQEWRAVCARAAVIPSLHCGAALYLRALRTRTSRRSKE